MNYEYSEPTAPDAAAREEKNSQRQAPAQPSDVLPYKEAKRLMVDKFERRYLAELLSDQDWNLSAASRVSGLSRKHIRTLMVKHDMFARCDLDR